MVLSGFHIGIYPQETLAHKEVDSVIIGEVEITFCELVEHLANGKSLDGVKVVGFKKNGKIFINQPR